MPALASRRGVDEGKSLHMPRRSFTVWLECLARVILIDAHSWSSTDVVLRYVTRPVGMRTSAWFSSGNAAG